MKNLLSFLFFISICSAVIAQSKEIIINLNHYYDGEEFIVAEYNPDESETFLVDNQSYSVNGNTPIKFFRMQYYLHINSLSNNDGDTTYLSDTYLLVNPSQNQYNIGPFEISDVNSLFFNIGVALEVNHNDPSLWNASHPLAPQNPSMHWGWAAGYRFVALEGMIDKNNDGILESVVQYHPVDDSYYSEIITCDGVVETNSTITFFIEANYDKLIENIGTDQGGVYHGVHYENELLINNFVTNEVFTTPSDLELNESRILNLIFPNPFSNKIQFDLNESANIKIYNMIGTLIANYRFEKGSQQISTTNLKHGIYLFSIESKSGTQNIKMLKN